MTLDNILTGYDWIQDPNYENRARIAGPDNSACIVVQEEENNTISCWLWSNKTSVAIGNTIMSGTPADLPAIIQALSDLRLVLGNCPQCRLPLGMIDDIHAGCTCGYVVEIEMVPLSVPELVLDNV